MEQNRASLQLGKSWDGIAIFIFLFLFCIACTHYLLAWLANEIGTRRGQSIRWRRRSSAALVSMLLLVFVIGMCMTGVVHQAGWLINSPVPFYVAEMQTQQDSDQSLHRPFEVDTSTGHNWLAASLVFIHYMPIDIDSTKAWNAPENEAPFRKFIPEVICPSRSNPKRSPDGFALSQVAANPIMVSTPNRRSSDLKDAAQTIFASEVNAAYMPWGSKGNSRALELGIQKTGAAFRVAKLAMAVCIPLARTLPLQMDPYNSNPTIPTKVFLRLLAASKKIK